MIQVKNLTITHRKDLRVILENFSMVLNDGDKAALIGEEGNGKSTLLKLLYDERLVEDYAEYSGEIIKNRARIGYLAQELTEEQKAASVYEFCAQSDVFYGQSPFCIRSRLRARSAASMRSSRSVSDRSSRRSSTNRMPFQERTRTAADCSKRKCTQSSRWSGVLKRSTVG